jgi:hypothetical protein
MNRLDQLRAALKLLASPAEKQAEYLADFFRIKAPLHPEHNVDEIALQFDDIASSAGDMATEGEITLVQKDVIAELNNFLSDITRGKPSEFWTVRALSCDSDWQAIRDRAHDCLRAVA